MKKITLMLFVAMLTLSANATFYVVPGGAGTMDGSSWSNAYADIQTAINAASTLYGTSSTPQEVWVKAGSYSTSAAALIMKESVSLYGGFDGSESDKTRAKGTNAWDYTNVTTLNGGATKRCIEAGAANYTNVTIIDGFTITNGNGVGAQLSNTGGGVLLRANLKLQNCIVTGNTTSGNGGGINSVGGLISNCWIYSNTTTSGTIPAAGGIYSAPASSFSTIIEDCLIERNAQGGVRFQSAGTTTLNRCIIRNNTSTGAGAAIYTNNPGVGIISNCLITNNSGTNVIYLNKGTLVNCTVANNEGIIYLASASNIGELYNNIIVNNIDKTSLAPVSVSVVSSYPTGKVKNNAVFPAIDTQTWGGSTNTLLITDAATALADVAFEGPTIFSGATGDAIKLTQISAAKWNTTFNSKVLNFGDNSLIPAGITTDFTGAPRIVNTTVDAGAYELPYYNTVVTFNDKGTVNALLTGDVLSIPKGSTFAFTITPKVEMKIASVYYNGTEVTNDLVGNIYTMPALTANATLNVVFDYITSLNEIKTNFVCFATKNSVELRALTAGDNVSVYSVTGTRLFNAKALNSEMSIPVGPGIFIVKSAGVVKKIIID